MARQTSRSLGLAHGQSKDKQRSSLIAITFVNTARRHGFCLSFFLMVDSDLVIGALVQKQELLAACGQWLQGGRYRLKPIPLDQLQDCWEGLDGMLIEADALDAAGLERLRRQGMLLPAVVIGEVTGGVTYHEAEMHLQPDQLEQLPYNLDAAVSRFLQQRLQINYFAAAALIHDRFPDERFAIIGSPFAGNEDHEKELRRFAGEHGISDRVIFCGECDDMGAAYSALDIVVLASGTPEPFGGVVIVAMANGRAVIGTDIGGTREQIANGTTGLLIPPDDPFAMSKAMARLFSDPKYREEMGDAGQQRFLQQFEFEPFYEKMTGLYRETLDWYSRPKKRALK